MVKDPLQTGISSYEVLGGLPLSADQDQIHQAYMQVLGRGGDPLECDRARAVLYNPQERLLEDVFYYVPGFMDKMGLAGSEDQKKQQLITRRQEILHNWLDQQNHVGLHAADTHNIGILSYWWALGWETNRLATAGAKVSEIPAGCPEPFFQDPLQLWKIAIANWAQFANCHAFGVEWARLSGLQHTPDAALWQGLARKIEGLLTKDLKRCKDAYQNLQQMDKAAWMEALIERLEIEMITAQALAKTGIVVNMRGRSMAVSCGPMMLEQMDLLEDVQMEIENARMSNAGVSGLERLDWYLSVFAIEYHRLLKEQYETVYGAVHNMKEKRRKSQKAQYLLARACSGLGRKRFEAASYSEAFNLWEEGLGTRQNQETLLNTIKACCMSKVPLYQTDPENTIFVLENGYRLTEDPEIRDTLVEIYVQRGMDIINAAQDALLGNPPDQIDPAIFDGLIHQIEQGIRYLEMALELDPDHARARSRLIEAKVIRLIFLAIRLITLLRWDEAITVLEQALDVDPDNDQVGDMHCNCCKSYAWEAFDNGHFDRAREILERGSRRNRRYRNELRLDLSKLLNAQGVKFANVATERVPMGDLKGALEGYDAALLLINEALEMNPGDQTILDNRDNIMNSREVVWRLLNGGSPPPVKTTRRPFKQWLRDNRWVAAVVIPVILAYLMKG